MCWTCELPQKDTHSDVCLIRKIIISAACDKITVPKKEELKYKKKTAVKLHFTFLSFYYLLNSLSQTSCVVYKKTVVKRHLAKPFLKPLFFFTMFNFKVIEYSWSYTESNFSFFSFAWRASFEVLPTSYIYRVFHYTREEINVVIGNEWLFQRL